MKNNKFSQFSVFNSFKGFVFGFILSVALVGGVVYAWNAIWHGTDWIQAGKVIESEKVAENFEWLYKRINIFPDPAKCNEGEILKWHNNKFVCTDNIQEDKSCDAQDLEYIKIYAEDALMDYHKPNYTHGVYHLTYHCPKAKNNQVVACIINKDRYGFWREKYDMGDTPIVQCMNGRFIRVNPPEKQIPVYTKYDGGYSGDCGAFDSGC